MSYDFEKDPSKITNFLLCLLVLSMFVSLVTVISDFMLLDLLNGPITQLQEQADAADRRQQIIGIAYVIVFIFTGITFLTWINIANKNCHNFGAKNMKFTSGWSIGYYFVPFLNLYKPYQAMKEIWKISKNPQNWKHENGSWLIVSWWLLWLVNGFVGNAIFKQTMKTETLKSIKFLTEISIASEVIYFLLCIVSIVMINSLIEGQKKLINRFDVEESSISIENNNGDFCYDLNINNNSSEIFSPEKNNNNITTPIEKNLKQEIDVPNNDLNNFYESALLEYENSNLVKFIHSKAIVEANGDNSKEKSLYIKMRVSDLIEEFKKRTIENIAKEENFSKEKEVLEEKRDLNLRIKNIQTLIDTEGINIDGKTYTSIKSAEDGIEILLNKVRTIRSNALDGQEVSMLCIEKGLNYDEVMSEMQLEIDDINAKIKKIKDAFYPLL